MGGKDEIIGDLEQSFGDLHKTLNRAVVLAVDEPKKRGAIKELSERVVQAEEILEKVVKRAYE